VTPCGGLLSGGFVSRRACGRRANVRTPYSIALRLCVGYRRLFFCLIDWLINWLIQEVSSYIWMSLYTVSQKKQDTKLLLITYPNVNRFSKFFHWQTQLRKSYARQSIMLYLSSKRSPLCWLEAWKIWDEETPFSAWAPSNEGRAHQMLMRVNIRCRICLSFSQSVGLLVFYHHQLVCTDVVTWSYTTVPVHFTNL